MSRACFVYAAVVKATTSQSSDVAGHRAADQVRAAPVLRRIRLLPALSARPNPPPARAPRRRPVPRAQHIGNHSA